MLHSCVIIKINYFHDNYLFESYHGCFEPINLIYQVNDMDMMIEQFIPLVDFLADILGSDAEIVLHDFTDINNSVIAIRNNHVSGREVGAPATDLALKMIQDASAYHQNYLTNYQGQSQNGKLLRSSSFMIRNKSNQIIGMLCINIDFNSQYDQILGAQSVNGSIGNAIERFSKTVDDVTDESINNILGSLPLPPERLSQEEKIDIIRKLNVNGIFLMRGSVYKIASNLKISEASVYRYLNKIRKEA